LKKREEVKKMPVPMNGNALEEKPKEDAKKEESPERKGGKKGTIQTTQGTDEKPKKKQID
jgi:hypothetical protein